MDHLCRGRQHIAGVSPRSTPHGKACGSLGAEGGAEKIDGSGRWDELPDILRCTSMS